MSQVKTQLMPYRYILLLLLIMAASFGFYVPKYGLIYDGGLYASLGYSLQKDGSYFFNSAPGDVPPVYSALLGLSVFFLGEKGIFTVTPLFSAIFICTVFLIFRREFDEDSAFLGALLVLFSPPIFFYAIQVVRDLPLMAFVMLSYLLYIKEERSVTTEVSLGVLIGLAFLTKYAAVIYLLPIFIHALYTKKPFKVFYITALVVLLPWMAWSYANHGTLLVSHSTYLTKGLGKDMSSFFTWILPYLVKWSFLPLFLLSLAGFVETAKKEKLNPFALLFILTVFTALFWPEKDGRYMLFAFVLFVYFALIFLTRFRKSYVILFL
ncbi:MAG: glycosyltransferase family 39 protein, partial [Candidatus Hydrothermarchaeales archaeon]